MASALISLGSNLGDRQATLDAALEKLRETAGIAAIVASTYHATKPVGGPEGQEEFLNAAARLETSLSPRQLLTELQRIEHELGRKRGQFWGPRTLDLDLLLFDREIIDEPNLVVPHRFLAFRRFVLEPAVEVASDMIHPILCWAVDDMLHHVKTAKNVLEVAGNSARMRREFALRVGRAVGYLVATRRMIRDGTPRPEQLFLESNWEIVGGTENYLVDSFGPWPLLEEAIEQNQPGDERFRQDVQAWLATFPDPKAVFRLGSCSIDTGVLQKRLHPRLHEQIDGDFWSNYIKAPTLVLPADDLNRAEFEAVAAIQAMQ